MVRKWHRHVEEEHGRGPEPVMGEGSNLPVSQLRLEAHRM